MTDPMGELIKALIAADEARQEVREKIREQRRNDPGLRAIRSRAAKKGWERRHAREAVERATEEAEAARWRELYDREGAGPWCDAMNIHPVDGEITCIRAPGHSGDCEDSFGHTWTREDDQ